MFVPIQIFLIKRVIELYNDLSISPGDALYEIEKLCDKILSNVDQAENNAHIEIDFGKKKSPRGKR